ncbi:MAG: translation initiation factor IF-3 [Christensenellales bacterium]|jgi:translation initiation factor IF-3
MINDEIRDAEVRLVDFDGTQLGILSSQEALKLAEEREMDLVKIAPQAKPPVCKIMDYGKFIFEQEKRQREARKNQKVITVKEIRLSPVIEDHDIDVRVKNCIKFLKEGNKIKVSIRFRGRMISHSELGLEVMKAFYSKVEEYAVIDRRPMMEGRVMTMMLSAKVEK